jgi:YYY domain-containing protein
LLLAPLLWLVALELLGLAALPLTHRVFSALPDRGYASAKFLGLIVLAYLSWSTGLLGLTAFTGSTIGVFAVVLAILSWWRWGDRAVSAWRETRPLAIAAEATFLVVFAGATWVRSFNAAIAGQEKQMDFTFLHSLISGGTLPAQDLWLAGFGLPYYYFGYFTQSLVGKVVPVDPAVAYNLAVATVLALGAVAAFGMVAALIRMGGSSYRSAIVAGGIAAFALTVMGNLEALFELVASLGIGDQAVWAAVGIKNLQANAGPFPPADGIWWFKAARVIPNIQPDGITEFPFFSFLLGDLHPHYMAIPLCLLIVALAAQALAAPASFGTDWLRLGTAAVVLGAVIPTNTWDVPIFWGIFGLAFLAGVAAGDLGVWQAIRERALRLGLIGLVAAVLYVVPYAPGYMAQPLGVGVVAERTMFGSLFVLFGPLLLLVAGGGLVAAYHLWRLDEGAGIPRWLPAAGLALGLLVAALREPTLGFLIATLALWIPVTWARVRLGAPPAATMTALLAVAGLASILVPELVFLRDVFGTRMNTVFKFYYDAWILLALAAPLLGWELLKNAVPGFAFRAPGRSIPATHRVSDSELGTRGSEPTPGWVRAGAGASLAVALLLAAGGALYPLAATPTKSGGFAGAATLDGMLNLRAAHPDDVAAIQWLRQNAPAAPLVEAVGGSYTDAGRFATFGANPTLLGWAGHESQWRGSTPEIGRREGLIRRIYTDDDMGSWMPELQQLGVRFIVLGDMERQIYRLGRGPAFEDSLPVAHRSGGTALYRVPASRVGGPS